MNYVNVFFWKIIDCSGKKAVRTEKNVEKRSKKSGRFPTKKGELT